MVLAIQSKLVVMIRITLFSSFFKILTNLNLCSFIMVSIAFTPVYTIISSFKISCSMSIGNSNSSVQLILSIYFYNFDYNLIN